MNELRLYGIEGNKLTGEIQKYLTMMRTPFEFIDITTQETLKDKLTEMSGGELRLVWLEKEGDFFLINSLAQMCNYLNQQELKNHKNGQSSSNKN